MKLDKPVIAWWSGGITSAVACKLAIDKYGLKNTRIIFIDTKNEDNDTYRFLNDCEQWYNKRIEIISNNNYKDIKDVWYKFKSLNVANGAICSSELKRSVRLSIQKENNFSYQIFGFDIDEPKRAKSLQLNYPESNPVFPLIDNNLSKQNCVDIINSTGIDIPNAYKLGYRNNNCFKTMCVQGGIGYWQKVKIDFPDKFNKMAEIEHELTNLKGRPVTMLRDQSKSKGYVFLKPHPEYPDIKDVSMMKGRHPKPLIECNGFCGINDLQERNTTYDEINFED